MTVIKPMKLFMEPESVALIGVKRKTAEGTLSTIENILKLGFSGRIYPINPNAERVLGLRAYPNVKDVEGEIDLAVISTPRETVLGIVEECIEKGIKAIVIVAQGFADADEEGKRIQEKVVRMAREGGARIVGPNTLGTANVFNKFLTSFIPYPTEEIPVGLICQSGMLLCGVPRLILAGKAIDLGNCSDIDFSDGLEYFEEDPEVKLVTLHMEGIKNGRRFIDVAGRVTKKKPVLAVKAGGSRLAVEAVESHTGSMAGKEEIYDAVFKQCGITRVNDMDEMEDLSKAFLYLPLMKGRRVGIATLSGGAGILVIDACEKYNLELSRLSSETLGKIEKTYPSWLAVRNPIDMAPGASTGEVLGKTIKIVLEALLSDENVDGVVFIVVALRGQDAFVYSDIISQMAGRFRDKPIVSWFYGPDVDRDVAKKYDATGGTVVYPTCERAVRALAGLAQRYEFLVGAGHEGDKDVKPRGPGLTA